MHDKYLQLFKELAHTVQLLSEQVMQIDNSKNDEKGKQAAQTMRNDYSQLYDKLRKPEFNSDKLEKKDYAKLLVGAIIVVKQLEKKLAAETKAISGYKTDVIPKLERMVNEAESQEERIALGRELFTIIEENQEKSET